MMRGYGYGYSDMMNGGWGYGILMLLFGLIFIALVVLLVIWAVRATNRSHDTHVVTPPTTTTTRDNACEIARARFAKGEITKAEYEEICTTLGV